MGSFKASDKNNIFVAARKGKRINAFFEKNKSRRDACAVRFCSCDSVSRLAGEHASGDGF